MVGAAERLGIMVIGVAFVVLAAVALVLTLFAIVVWAIFVVIVGFSKRQDDPRA